MTCKTAPAADRPRVLPNCAITQRDTGDRHHLEANLQSSPVRHAEADARYAAGPCVAATEQVRQIDAQAPPCGSHPKVVRRSPLTVHAV
jgi:hypothetical protein